MVTKSRGYGAWQQDFADTIPAQPSASPGQPEPAELTRLLRHLRDTSPRCRMGPCQQGRRCPTPVACHVMADDPADDSPPRGGPDYGVLVWPLVMLALLVLAALGLALVP